MKISSIPLSEQFDLKTDPSGETTIIVRQAREGENIERNDFFSKITRVYEDPMLGSMGLDGRLKLQVEQNEKRLRRKEAYLTLGSVTGLTYEDGTELFRSQDTVDGRSVKAAMSEEAFNRAWALLPSDMATEISEHVRSVNLAWSPEGAGE